MELQDPDHKLVNGVPKAQATPKGRDSVRLSTEEELVLKTFRILIADLCQQFSGGHPGYVEILPTRASSN